MGHSLVQSFFHVIRDTLLGAVDIGGSVCTAERIVYIAGDPEMTFFQKGILPIGMDGFNLCQSLSALAWIISICICERKAQSLEHANTSVICGASSYADDEISAAFFHGIQDHFAHTVCRGQQRIFFSIADKGDASGGSHFNDGGLTFGKVSIVAVYRSSKRTSCGHLHFLSVHTLDECVCCALSAVCQRFYDDFCAWFCKKDPFLGGISGFHGREASFK